MIWYIPDLQVEKKKKGKKPRDICNELFMLENVPIIDVWWQL